MLWRTVVVSICLILGVALADLSLLRDLGCCRPANCENGYDSCIDEKLQCPDGFYIRKCLSCCGVCEKYLKNGEQCWRAMDLAYCRLGKCEPPLVCSKNGSCLSSDVGEDWGRDNFPL